MPKLEWSSKSDNLKSGGSLITESILFPGTEDKNPARVENRLILGDNLRVMNSLLGEYEGKLDLIYVDPPFFTNKGYPARVGRGEDLDSYLDMLYPRLKLMHRLLSPTGSLYLHLDWHANSYARVLLDEIFGYENFRNEIIWTYHGPSPIRTAFNRKHDTILFYTKTDDYVFNVDDIRIPYAPNTVATFKSSKKAGFGKVPDLERGKVPEDWWYFPVVARLHQERTGYPTQKPERLLERIILASTNPDGLVADFFCGAGTTGTVANRLNRRFILSDLQNRAIITSRSRLVLKNQELGENRAELEGPALPVYLQREEGRMEFPLKSLEEMGFPEISIEAGVIHLPPELVPNVDYWEVDPDWQGKVFRSRYQAVRPLRKGDLPSSMILPETGGKICLRIVLISGEQIQQVLN